MSRFSGKCDFYDGFVAIRCDGEENKIDKELKNLKLYVRGKDGRDHLVKSDTLKDIVKYYPYLEAIAVSSKDSCTIIISADSFIDTEERERLDYRIQDVLKYWRKCKRNKIPFTKEEFYRNTWWKNDSVMDEICKRVVEDGDKAEFNNLHDSIHEYYRREWFNELVRVGYTELEAYNWVFKGLFDKPEVIEKRLGRPIKKEEE